MSSAPEASSSSIAPARACICAVLSSARWIAWPTSPISVEMPEKASLILVCASAAVYVALIVSLRVRKASTLACSCCEARVSFSSSPWSWACCSLRSASWPVSAGLAGERLAGEVLAADLDRLLGLPGELARLALQLGDLHLDPLAAGGHVGDPASYLREHLELPLVAVVEGLARVLRAVERLARLRLEDHRESLPQAHRMVPLSQVRVRAAAVRSGRCAASNLRGQRLAWIHRSPPFPALSRRKRAGRLRASSRTTHPKAT